MSGGPGEKNLLLAGYYAAKKMVPHEVELPSTWEDLVKKSKDYNKLN